MNNFHNGDLMVDNFWVDNITTLIMYVGLVVTFIIVMQIFGPQDGEKTEKTNGHNDNR